jgi:hypothetical protein
VPQIRSEQLELVDPAKNPFFGHARVQLFIAKRGGKPVGRISAHIDEFALAMPAEQGFGPGTGFFGYFDAEDEERGPRAAHRRRGVAGGRRHDPRARPDLAVDLGRARPAGARTGSPADDHDGPPPGALCRLDRGGRLPRAKTLYTYDLNVSRTVSATGAAHRPIGLKTPDQASAASTRRRWDEEVAIILGILNDAWSDNWGFVPFTPAEVAYAGKKLRRSSTKN